MKRVTTLFQRNTYLSEVTGAARKYFHDARYFKALGQSTWLRVDLYGYRASSNNAQVRIEVWETSIDNGRRPSEIGSQVGSTVIIGSLRPAPVTFNGPYGGLVEIVVFVEDATATAEEQFDFEVGVTTYMD